MLGECGSDCRVILSTAHVRPVFAALQRCPMDKPHGGLHSNTSLPAILHHMPRFLLRCMSPPFQETRQLGRAHSAFPPRCILSPMQCVLQSTDPTFLRDSAVGKSTAARAVPTQAPTASPSSKISPFKPPWSPSSWRRDCKSCSSRGAAALNCCRMPPAAGDIPSAQENLSRHVVRGRQQGG